MKVSIKPIKLDVRYIELGMYVSALDRPWQKTPFPIQGFYVRDRSEIKQLKVHCQYVYIDIIKGIAPSDKTLLDVKTAQDLPDTYRGPLKAIYVDDKVYQDRQTVASEMTLAHAVYDRLMLEMATVMGQITTRSKVSPMPFINASYAMVDSIVRNPDAFMWLVRVRKMDKKDPFYYLLRSAAWSVVFGQHLGLSKTNLRVLALSTILRDVGRLTLPKVLLSIKAGDPCDSGVGKIVVEQTITLLKDISDIPPKVIKTVSMMFERLNGSGYPKQLQGDEISFLSKIAGVAVFYDEATYRKGELCSIPSSQSISRLYEARGKQFQDDLVVEFIKAFGLYPTGTLVKLSTGEIAIVAEQNYARRLKPRVMVVVDKRGEALDQLDHVDLMVGDMRSIALPLPSHVRKTEAQIPSRIDIAEDVQPYDYPIKVTKIRERYINFCS
ncbi:MAG: HD-GYP domain-containing protein (c-di-GMP phosphodiesterase class II) [Candidatus Endobugula sp.]